MGLINAGMKLNGGPLQTDPVRPGMGMAPMGMPPMQGGMPGAFSNNPAFLAQLQALMAGQGPGMSPPQFTPPMAPMTPPTQGGGGFTGVRPNTPMGVRGMAEQLNPAVGRFFR